MGRDPNQRTLEELRRVYAPEPPSTSRRAALRAGVDARLESRSGPRSRLVLIGVLGLVTAALVAWLVVVRPAPQAEARRVAAHAWVEDVLFGAEEHEVTVPLPGEYAALSEVLGR